MTKPNCCCLVAIFIMNIISDASSKTTNQSDRLSVEEPRVVVKRQDGVVARQPVDQFFHPNETDGKAVIRRDLFLQAFQILLQKHHDDPRSFYQIAGIHGLPYTVYDNITDVSKTAHGLTGYCAHGSVLFPTWHRPYLLFIEQEIINCAKEFISKMGSLATDAKYQLKDYNNEVKRIRFPYWDWASYHTQAFGVPQIFLDHTIEVTYPRQNTIKNPLRCYVLPVELVDERYKYSSAPECIPTASPNYKPFELEGTPVTPAQYPTIRHPTESYQSNVDQLQFDFIQASTLLLRPGVFNMFKTDQYIPFSNHFSQWGTPKPGSYGLYSSLEWVHDNVHILLGGAAGHMSYPQVAAFDPIFFFHHTNVDRLFAIWQAIYPTQWVTTGSSEEGTIAIRPGQKVNATTELFPFRKYYNNTNDTSIFWNSNDVRSIQKLGYTYPELQEIQATSLLKQMLQLYRPIFWGQERVIANFTGIQKNAFNGPYNLLIFVNVPQDKLLTTPTTNINFAGRVGIFSRGTGNQCSGCIASAENGKTITFIYDITTTVLTLKLRIDNLPLHNDDPSAGPPTADSSTALYLTVSAVAEYAGKRHLMPKIKVNSIRDRSDWFPDENTQHD